MVPQFPTPKPYHFVEFSDVEAMLAAAVEPLKQELVLLKSLQSEWVRTKEAKIITGVSGETLKAERERVGTKLIFKFEGKTGKSPRYLRSSLIAYNEAKTWRRIQGRNLA